MAFLHIGRDAAILSALPGTYLEQKSDYALHLHPMVRTAIWKWFRARTVAEKLKFAAAGFEYSHECFMEDFLFQRF
jgi:hypothetical protein